jgi:predicted nucleotidyltransferase
MTLTPMRLSNPSVRIDRETAHALQCFLAMIADRFDLAGAILYGSRARGTHRPDSDADVAVLLRGEHRRVLPTTLAMSDLAEAPNPALLREIARDGIRL